MVGSDQLSQPPPSPVNDPRGASGMGGPADGGAQSPGAVGTLLGTASGGGLAAGGTPPGAMDGILQMGQQLTETIQGLAQAVPIMAPKLAQAKTLIEQALADFLTSSAGAAPVPMGGAATPGALSTGAAFPRM